jgi:hypothetical protein
MSRYSENILSDSDDSLADIPRQRKAQMAASQRKAQMAASPGGSLASGATRQRRNTRGDNNKDMGSGSSGRLRKKDRIQSFQDAIIESMEETQRMRQSSTEQHGDSSSVLIDTMRDIKSAAFVTIASIKEWADRKSQASDRAVSSTRSYEYDERQRVHRGMQSSIMRDGSESAAPQECGTPNSEPANMGSFERSRKQNSIIQDLVWPFVVCGIDVSEQLPKRNELVPQLKKMKDAVNKVVHGDLRAANDIWKFAAGSRDDDDNTIGTLDTLQEETNQLRRLGSWGTVGTTGTSGTNGTAETGFNSLDLSGGPMEINVGPLDDEGNPIDPLLLETTQRTRGKRNPRRERLVRFDYPPIKSLRQCPRHDPAMFPDLWFTEHELDQIEDDRYSTMSIDDIEIVAVASKSEQGQTQKSKLKGYKSPRARRGAAFADPPVEARHSLTPSSAREPPETGWKQAKARPTTPYRHRRQEDEEEEAEFPTSPGAKSTESGGRLVKGVQIYLRERSTGA